METMYYIGEHVFAGEYCFLDEIGDGINPNCCQFEEDVAPETHLSRK